jgi:transcriptional regulator of acetoin/glycerol metabolism
VARLTNPWLALDVATDPVAHARRLRRAHERAVNSGEAGRDFRALVADSWRRSIAAGVAPDAGGAPLLLRADELEAARENSPLALAVTAIAEALGDLDSDGGYMVAIADADATLLWVSGDPAVRERARAMRFQEGAAWSERTTGTNAVGTAAALDHAVQIFSAEHLVEAVHDWTCAAAPIHDPVTAEVLGVVDLTSQLRAAHPHTLSAAALAAQAAEAMLRVRLLERSANLRERWEAVTAGRRAPSILVDSYGRVLASRGAGGTPARLDPPPQAPASQALPDGSTAEVEPLDDGAILWLTSSARRRQPRLRLRLLGHGAHARFGADGVERGLRSLELLAVLAMHPEGLTAEQLALAIYGEEGKTVTVRAQVHRLRAHLGEGLVQTLPYRLTGTCDADWLRVQRLIAEGRPDDALRAYPAPLLPSSEAPEIVEARGLLEESLRRSLLTTGDPDLLWRWLNHCAGADDVAAARTLVNVLPSGDPRRAAATATLTAVKRRLGFA